MATSMIYVVCYNGKAILGKRAGAGKSANFGLKKETSRCMLPLLKDILNFHPFEPSQLNFSPSVHFRLYREVIIYHTFIKKVNPPLHTFLKLSISTYFHDFDLS
jgi:hypothetical protein